MSRDPSQAAAHDAPDRIGSWLIGGFVGGLVLLGLLIAAYEVGYHHGRDAAGRLAAPPAPAATVPTRTTAAPTTTTAPTSRPVVVTPALVARGRSLYVADGCSGCHSLNGSAGAGPTFKGLDGRSTALATGQTITADDAYIERSITDPDAQIVKGFHAGIMAPAIAAHDLAAHPADVQALVAFIKSQK